MARKSKKEKILSIEDQIKELEEKRKIMLESLYLKIGKHVVNEWGTNDEDTLMELITSLKDEALSLQEDANMEKETS